MSRHGHYAWVVGTLLLHLGMAVMVDWHMSTTYDEPAHLKYGIHILRVNPEREVPYFDSKMPVSVLNALPSGMAQFMSHRGWMPHMVDVLQSMWLARLPTIVASLFL